MFGKQSIDKILGDISKKIGQLRDVAEQHAKATVAHEQEVVRHSNIAADYAKLRDRATRVAEKFEELLK